MWNDNNNNNNEDKPFLLGTEVLYRSLMLWLCLWLGFVLIGGVLNFSVNKVAQSQLSSISQEITEVSVTDTLRCVSLTPCFEINGDKSYEATFRVMDRNGFVHCRIPAKFADELGTLQEDAKYDVSLIYSFNSDLFDLYLKGQNIKIDDLTTEEKFEKIYNTDIGKDYSVISGVDFLFSKYITDDINGAVEGLKTKITDLVKNDK